MSSATTPAQLEAALRWRYATKAFDPRPIPADVWKALEHALQLAPSSYGLQPWKFLVVADPARRALLRPNSWGQSQVTDASHLVVFTRQTSVTEADVQAFYDQLVSERRADPAKLEPYRQMMVQNVAQGMSAERQREWAARQVYIALGQFMTAAAVLGVDTCPLEGIDPAKYD
ncbi:MAG: NAD(P)H-dependent oxidoreductase [Opitutia bacterium]